MMLNILSSIKTIMILATLTVTGIFAQHQEAKAYDIDCKVILCLAGGFPAGCGNAYSYMIDRITDRPPKPPFGFCAMSDGSEYKAHDVNYRFIGSGPSSYVCEDESKTLFYRRNEQDRGVAQETAFCYSHVIPGRTRTNRFGDLIDTTAYANRSPARRVNFELNIVIEPNTAHEYRSPLFRINTSTGFVSQRPR